MLRCERSTLFVVTAISLSNESTGDVRFGVYFALLTLASSRMLCHANEEVNTNATQRDCSAVIIQFVVDVNHKSSRFSVKGNLAILAYSELSRTSLQSPVPFSRKKVMRTCPGYYHVRFQFG